MLFSILLMFAAIVIYYEYMTQQLYPVLAAIGRTDDPTKDISMDIKFDRWPSLPYVCILFSILCFPVISKRELSLFIKIGSYGVIFVSIVILFIISTGVYSLFSTQFDISNKKWESSEPRHLSFFKSNFGPLSGMMCLGYYLHNCVIPIL